MARVDIIKGNIRNIVEEEQYEKLYKPNGWRLDESVDNSRTEPNIPFDSLNTKNAIDNYIKMKNKKPKHFDDGLFKSDIQD